MVYEESHCKKVASQMNKTPITIPALTTERLSLVPLAPTHSRLMFDLWSNPDVCRYSGIVSDYDGNQLPIPTTTVAVSDKIIDFWQRACADGWGFRWAILDREAGVPVGTVGFNALGSVSEIAYHRRKKAMQIVTLASAPINVAPILKNLLFDSKKSVILTSATLAINLSPCDTATIQPNNNKPS